MLILTNMSLPKMNKCTDGLSLYLALASLTTFREPTKMCCILLVDDGDIVQIFQAWKEDNVGFNRGAIMMKVIKGMMRPFNSFLFDPFSIPPLCY